MRPQSLVFAVLLLLAAPAVYSQYEQDPPANHTHPASNAVFAELGGPGMLLSVNYDKRLSGRKDGGWGIRAGLGYSLSNDPGILSVPVGVNYLAGHRGNYFEMGAGATYITIGNPRPGTRISLQNKEFYDPAHLFFGNIVLGYRYQPVAGGFHFRAGITPYFGEGTFNVLPYIGLGVSF